MVCPALTLTATAVRRADGLSNMVSASTAILLAIGLGVWSEPQGYAVRVFLQWEHRRGKSVCGVSNMSCQVT